MAFVARLCDVAPDGTSALVTTGVLNGTRRASLTQPEPMDPEQIYELDIELDCTAWRFAPGHRIRLAVSSADFPNLWPTPFPGTNRVYRGAGTPSRLLLPVVPIRQPDDEAAPTPAVAPVSPYTLGPDERPWELVHDVLGDRTGLRTVPETCAARPRRPSSPPKPASACGRATATPPMSWPRASTAGASSAPTAPSPWTPAARCGARPPRFI